MPDLTAPPPAPVGETFRRSLDATVSGGDGQRSVFTIMTGGLARDGMIVDPAGLDVSAYLSNPVVLWQHGWDPLRGNLPVARALTLTQTEGDWRAEIDYAPDEFAQNIGEMVRGGFLSAVSIGWRTLDAGWETRDGQEVYVVRRAELHEFSIVAVPADADALALQRAYQQVVTDEAQTEEIEALRARVAALEAATPEPTEDAASEPAPVDAPPPPVTPRTATPEEYAALAVHVVGQIHLETLRAHGRA